MKNFITKTKYFKIISIMLTTCLLFGALPFQVLSMEELPEDTQPKREFDPRYVLVVLKREYSRVNAPVEHLFEGMGFKEIRDTWAMPDKDEEWIREYEASVEFHQIISLTLEEPGESNVWAAVEQLSQLEYVLAAEPDYYYYPVRNSQKIS